MKIMLSSDLETIASYARDEAMRTGTYGIGIAHLCLAAMRHADNPACRILRNLGIELKEFKRYLDSSLMTDKSVSYYEINMVRPTRDAKSVFSISAFEALKRGHGEVNSAHLLLAICRTHDNPAVRFLSDRGIGYEQVLAEMCKDGFKKEAQKEYIPKMDEISGALGEQLNRIFGNIDNQYNFYS